MMEHILLGFLMGSNMTGYDIKQRMIYSTAYFVDASYGTIYPTLKKLVKKGLIELEEVIDNGKLKKVYSINEQGISELKKWLNEPIEASRVSISSVLAKIFFFQYLPKERVVIIMEQYLKDIEVYKTELMNLQKIVEKEANTFEMVTLDFGLDYYNFIIKWYEKYLKEYKGANSVEI